MRKTHICSLPTMIFTICYRQSKTAARKWTSTFRNDMQEMQDYRRRDIVLALSSSWQLWKLCQQHGKLCFLQCEDTTNCWSLRHVGLAYTRCSRLAYGW